MKITNWTRLSTFCELNFELVVIFCKYLTATYFFCSKNRFFKKSEKSFWVSNYFSKHSFFLFRKLHLTLLQWKKSRFIAARRFPQFVCCCKSKQLWASERNNVSLARFKAPSWKKVSMTCLVVTRLLWKVIPGNAHLNSEGSLSIPSNNRPQISMTANFSVGLFLFSINITFFFLNEGGQHVHWRGQHRSVRHRT